MRLRRFVAGGGVASLLLAGVGLVSPAAWADPAAATEVDLAWQDAKYNVDPPATVKSGTLLNAAAHLNRNFDHDVDKDQAAGNRVFTFVTEGGFVSAVPKYCLEGPKTTLSEDKKTLTCEYNADATHGVASEFVIPVTAQGVTGTVLTATITDDAGKSASAKSVAVQGAEGTNVVITTQKDTGALYYTHGLIFVLQVQTVPNGVKPGGPVTFDLKGTWKGTGTAPDKLDPSKIQFLSRGTPAPREPMRGVDTGNDLNGATWKAVQDPADPWHWTITVEGFGEPLRTDLSHARVRIPLKADVTPAEAALWGRGNVEFVVSKVSYVASDGQTVVSDPAKADTVSEDSTDVFAYNPPGMRAYNIAKWTNLGDYGYSLGVPEYTTPTAFPEAYWDGRGVTVPGGVALGANTVRVPDKSVSMCNILPKGQGATFTGEWLVRHNVDRDQLKEDPRKDGPDGSFYYTQWEGLPEGLAKDTSSHSMGALALKNIPQGVTNGTLWYYTGTPAKPSLDFDDECNGDEGWTKDKPADMSTVSGMRLLNYDKTELPGGVAPLNVEFSTFYKVDETTAPKTPIWSSAANTRDASQPMTRISPRPNKNFVVEYADAPQGYAGTYAGIDRFSVLSARARNGIVIEAADVNPHPGAEVPVKVRWGTFGAKKLDYPGKLTVTLPAGTTYVAGSASANLGEPKVSPNGLTLTWDKSTKGAVYEVGDFKVISGGTAGSKTLRSSYKLEDKLGAGDPDLIKYLTATSSTSYILNSAGSTIVTVTAPEEAAATNYVAPVVWTIKTQNDDAAVQKYQSSLSVLPYVGDGRGTDLKSGGAKFVCDAVVPAANTDVYYATTSAVNVDRSPLSRLNGGVTSPKAGMWTKLAGTDLPAGTTAVWFISKDVASGVELTNTIKCRYVGDKSVSPLGAKLGFSAVSAAQTTVLKTIEASDTTVIGKGSPIKADKVWGDSVVGDPAAPFDADGLIHFSGSVKVAEGNGATDLVITDHGGNGLVDVKFTKVSAGSFAGNVWRVDGHTAPVKVLTYEGTAKLDPGLVGPVEVTNKLSVVSKENPKPGDECVENAGVDADTDQCDVVRLRVPPVFTVSKTGGKDVRLAAGQTSFDQSYTVRVDNTGRVKGTSAKVTDTPGVPAGFTVAKATVNGAPVNVDAGVFTVSDGVELAAGASREFQVVVSYTVDPTKVDAATWKALSTCEAAPGGNAGGAPAGLVNTVAMDGDETADAQGTANNSACSAVTGTPGITVVKSINGEDANQAPGVAVAPGEPMRVSFRVSNTGVVPLSGVVVTDSVITDAKAITCPKDTLAFGEEMTCTASLPAPVVGVQHENTATVSGTDPYGVTVTDDDPAHAAVAGFAVSKTAVDSGVRVNGTAGERVSAGFVVTVENTGLVEGVSSDVVDTPSVPAGMKLVSVRVDGKPVTGALDSFVVIPSSSVPAGKKIQARVEVTYQVEAALSQAQWDVLSQCQTGQDGNKGYGLFNVVSSDQDTTGSGDNDACVPLTPPGAGSLAYTGASLTGLGLLALVTALGGIGLVVARRRA